jgi:L-threonylcarbamoyladenylate synthase
LFPRLIHTKAPQLIVPATPENVDLAARYLREGSLVAFPTETVYGLGADARNAGAVQRIFAAKGRPAQHPLIVHIEGITALPRWAREVPDAARSLAAAFWPGPLTLILLRAAGVSDVVTGGQDSVGVRVPGHPVARALLAKFAERGGDGIAAPSANRFGRISATRAEHVAEEFGDRIALILDDGATRHGIESTIVDLTTDEPAILRPGAITAEQIERTLARKLRAAGSAAPRASGTLDSHYSPSTVTRLMAGRELVDALGRVEPGSHIAVLAHSTAKPSSFDGAWIAAPRDSDAFAHNLYANLRTLDSRGASEIWVEAPPEGSEWVAVNDRLRRAAFRR